MGACFSVAECGVDPINLGDRKTDIWNGTFAVVSFPSVEAFSKQLADSGSEECATSGTWQPMPVSSEPQERQQIARSDTRHKTPPNNVHAYDADGGAILADFNPHAGKLHMTFEYVNEERVPE